MRILITGANSATGQAILRCAAENDSAPDELAAAVRSERAADQIRTLLCERISAVRISYDDAGSLDKAFQGANAIIHLAGILVERPGSTYQQANVAPGRSVVEAAKRCAVERFVLVSATGADEKSSNGYYRTKGQVEALVRSSGLCYTILRAPLLLGPLTEGAAALARHASGAKARLIGGGRNLQQPLYVDDLARAALAATRLGLASHRTLDLVGPVSLTERELVERAAHTLGHEIRISSIPKGLLKLILSIRQSVSGPGFSPDALEVITADTRLDPGPAANELGIRLTGLDEMIQNSLSQEPKNE
ncbi:MAG TPA: NAD(P)H-binding protein [Bryobacteraceae bacterium]|nr:NAD(P)H-binding protein [Bryobacteraceae bacterium]